LRAAVRQARIVPQSMFDLMVDRTQLALQRPDDALDAGPH
jgi:hypothetical protein